MASPDYHDPLSDLAFVVGFANTLEDLGIEPVAYYRVWAACSVHGTMWAIWDHHPKPGDMLSCAECHDPTRRCLIYAAHPDKRPQ